MQIRIPIKIQIRLENFTAISLLVKCNVDPKNIKIRLKNIYRFLQKSNTYQQNLFLLFEKCAIALVFACKIINANLANRNPIYHVPKLMKSIRCFQTKSYKNLRFHQNCMLFELAGSAVLDLDAKMNASLTIFGCNQPSDSTRQNTLKSDKFSICLKIILNSHLHLKNAYGFRDFLYQFHQKCILFIPIHHFP